MFVTNPDTDFVQVQTRQINIDGQLKVNNYVCQPLAKNRGPNFFEFPLAEGFLLNAEAIGVGLHGSVRGELYVQLSLTRAATAGGLDYAMLVAGYQVTGCNPHWPGGNTEHPVSGHGLTYATQGVNGGAGTEATITVPAGARWRIVGGRLNLTTSAAAGNRVPRLTITSGASLGFTVGPVAAQPPGLLRGYQFAPALPLAADALNNMLLPIPENVQLRAGDSISTLTTNLDAADQYDQFFLLIEEWLEWR